MAIRDRAAKLRRPRAVLVQHHALPRLAFALAAMLGCGRLPAHTARFATPAALADNAFVAADPALLAEALCIEEARVVARDNTVVYDSRRLQLPARQARASYVKARVRVREYPDGTLPRPAADRRLHRAGGADRRGPDHADQPASRRQTAAQPICDIKPIMTVTR